MHKIWLIIGQIYYNRMISELILVNAHLFLMNLQQSSIAHNQDQVPGSLNCTSPVNKVEAHHVGLYFEK